MADDKRHSPGRRRYDGEVSGRLAAIEERMDKFEENHRQEYTDLRALMQHNTSITERTFARVEPYLSNIEAIDKFTAALSTVAGGLEWFGRKVVVWLRPLLLAAVVGTVVVAIWRAARNGDLLELLLRLVGVM